MQQLPKRNIIPFLLKGLGKSPAEMFQPDYEKCPVGYRVGAPLNISVIYQPALVHHFLGKENKNLSKNLPVTEIMKLALGHGILTMHGSEWLEQRRKLQPLFPKIPAGNTETEIEAIIFESIEKLKQEKVKNWESLKTGILSCLIDLNWFQLFGKRFPGAKAAIMRDIARGNKLLAIAVAEKVPVYNRMIKAQLKACYTGLKTAIDPVIRDKEVNDFNISTDEVINVLLAGAVTTTGNILFCLLHLAQDKKNFSRFLTDETFHRFTLMENIRLHPGAWSIWYKAETDIEHESLKVKKDDLLVFDLYAMHRHPAYWQQPELFDPNRFSGFDKSQLCYLPFGHGPRKCMGQDLAFTTLSSFLKQLGEAFNFFLKPGTAIKPQFGAILFPEIKPESLYFEDKKGN